MKKTILALTILFATCVPAFADGDVQQPPIAPPQASATTDGDVQQPPVAPVKVDDTATAILTLGSIILGIG
jgi:hypothetical protein